MQKELIIIGGGGHAKVVISAANSTGVFVIKGILDSNIPKGKLVSGWPVIGDDSLLLEERFCGSMLTIGVGLTKVGDARRKIYDKLVKLRYQFAIIKHNSAIISEKVEIGTGSQIFAGVIVQPYAKIGLNCILNTSAIIEHDCRIGDHCHIAPGAVLGGGVSVNDGSIIGLGARVLPYTKIGKNVTVAAGAVVIQDVQDNLTVAGIPAKQI